MLQDKKLQMEKLNQYNDVVSIFYKETDRASAVLSASFLENLLEDYLRKFMITEKMVDNLFNGQGPLPLFHREYQLVML